MITEARIRQILNTASQFGDIKFAFKPSYASQSYTPDPQGITEQEDKYIHEAWRAMSRNSCYRDALTSLLNNK